MREIQLQPEICPTCRNSGQVTYDSGASRQPCQDCPYGRALDWHDTLRGDILSVRMYLWTSHGCIGLYGDDGEMQCNNITVHGRPLDYLREPLSDLIEADRKSREKAHGRTLDLEAAIKTHRMQKADDRCIEDDDRLYEALGDGIKCDRRVGNLQAMLENCKRFIKNRCEAGGPWNSYAELEKDYQQALNGLKHLGEEWDRDKNQLCDTITHLKAEVRNVQNARTMLAEKFDLLNGQNIKLANFIMGEIPGEPSAPEGAVDTAIRLLRAKTLTQPSGQDKISP
jgi:hypothetical protein